MSETWYQTTGYGKRITPLVVQRYTDSSVWVGGRRRARVTDWESVFPTWEEAKAHLLSQADKNLQSARAALARAQAEYGNIKGMKDPAIALAQGDAA